MAASSFEHADEARAALRAIVSDPAHGPAALDNVRATANLLQDFLPDAPRETDLLVAAARAGLPAMLRGYVAQGMDVTTAMSLAASSFADRTSLRPEACEWVTGELAIALGLAQPDQVQVRATPAPRTPEEIAAGDPNRTVRAAPRALAEVRQPGARAGDSATAAPGAQRARRRRPLVLLSAGLAVAALATGIVLLRWPTSHRPPRTTSDLPVLFDCGGQPQKRPASYILACGDGSAGLQSLRWTSWTVVEAIGSGQLRTINCTPTCAAGTPQYTPVQITLTDLNRYGGANGVDYFTRMVLTGIGGEFPLIYHLTTKGT